EAIVAAEVSDVVQETLPMDATAGETKEAEIPAPLPTEVEAEPAVIAAVEEAVSPAPEEPKEEDKEKTVSEAAAVAAEVSDVIEEALPADSVTGETKVEAVPEPVFDNEIAIKSESLLG